MVLLLAMLAVLMVPSGAQKTPQQVNIDYPFLTRVSEYLATKYEQDNLDKAAQKADQMILLDALAERTTANVVKEREAKLPFAGGIEVPVQTKVAEAGNLYFISGIIEQQSKSYAIRKLDPWPMWQLVLGKLFRADEGKVYVIRYITAKRTTVPLSSQSAQAAIKFAMEGLNSRMDIHRLASVIAVEKQALLASDFRQLTVTELNPAPSLEVYYIYFLTSDKRAPDAPATEHAVAVLRTPKELKIVRHSYFGEPGFTIVKGTVNIEGVGVGAFTASKKNAFKRAMALTLGSAVSADDVQIINMAAFSATAASAANAAQGRRLGSLPPQRPRTQQVEVEVGSFGRVYTHGIMGGAGGASSTVLEDDVQLDEELDQTAQQPQQLGDGTQISFSISLAGSAAAVERKLQQQGFNRVFVSNLQSAGLTGVKQQALTMQQQVVLSNTQKPPSNRTIGFVVLTMGAFVLGVILTAGIGVLGMRRNRQVTDNSGGMQGVGGSGSGYQTVAGGEQ